MKLVNYSGLCKRCNKLEEAQSLKIDKNYKIVFVTQEELKKKKNKK